MFNLAPVYSARKSSNHKLSINHKISHDTNLQKDYLLTKNTEELFGKKSGEWASRQKKDRTER